MTRNKEDRFDSITGVPMYPLKNCEYEIACSYPYCSCRVPHNRHDEPIDRHARYWDWSVIAVLALLAAFWITVGWIAAQVWPW